MIGAGRQSRLVRSAVAAVFAAPIAAAVIGFGLSQQAYDAGDVEAALRLNPLSAEARSAGAAYLIADGKHADAEKLAAASINHSPLNPEAAAILGYIAEIRSGPGSAREFMETGAAMSWDNETAQLWMLRAETASLDFDKAILRTDSLLRQRLRRKELFTFLRGVALNPEATGPLARRLALSPKWRWDYLKALAGLTETGFKAHEALLKELKETAAPPTSEEVNAYVSHLVATGFYSEARGAWIRLTGQGEHTELNDGQFRRLKPAGEGSPFEWARTGIAGVSLRLEASARIGNVSALHITAEGRPSGPALQQIVVLSSGTYLLAASALDIEPGSLDSLDWRLSCLGGGGRPGISSLPAPQSETDWQRVERVVTIPSSACPAQRVELRVDHDEGRDLDAWIRIVQIRRIG